MTTAHCPSCDAAVAAGAPWCTLCFTSLVPKPSMAVATAPTAPPAPVPAPVPAPASASVEPALPPHPILDAPVFRPADVKLVDEPRWPCGTCGESVPLEETACPACGSGFMAAAKSSVSLVIPGIGDVAAMSKGGRFALMAAGALLCTAVLYLVSLVLGHLV